MPAPPEPFRAPIGTRDVLPPESARRRALVSGFAEAARLAGYGEVVTPVFEDLGVFLRVGESTEIVTKEMYDFDDKGGRRIALRPELTASVVRAYVQHRPVPPWKVWYAGPMFRYEKPQAGRSRQFEQVGVEALGVDDPDLDAEVVALAWRVLAGVGLRQVTLLLNSLGDAGDRERYLAALRGHLDAHAQELSEQSRATLAQNPLRVLDSKRAEDAEVVAAAPSILDHLSDASAAHFERVQAGLRALGVPFTLAPRLVRGLDYYRRTTFELVGGALDAAQNALGGGGRYDGLAEDLGGSPTPGIGFALGVDRTLLACDAEGTFPAPELAPVAFVVDLVGGHAARDLTHSLRAEGIAADRAWDGRSMKAQMKAADRSGARVAVIVGDDEAAAGTATVRPLRGGGEQAAVPLDQLVSHLREHHL